MRIKTSKRNKVMKRIIAVIKITPIIESVLTIKIFPIQTANPALIEVNINFFIIA